MYYNQENESYKKEIAGLMLGAVFLFLALSCVTYSPTDPSLLHYNSAHPAVSNWCGTLGAHISALLFYFWGSVAYFFLALIGLISYMIFAGVSFAEHGDRFIGIWVLLVASSLTSRIFGVDIHGALPGGVLGYYGVRFLYPLVSVAGAKIVAGSLMLAGFMWATRLSLLEVVRSVLVKKLTYALTAVHVVLVAAEWLVRGIASASVYMVGAFLSAGQAGWAWYAYKRAGSATEKQAGGKDSGAFWDEIGELGDQQENESSIRLGMTGKGEYSPEVDERLKTQPQTLMKIGEHEIKGLPTSVTPKDYSSRLLVYTPPAPAPKKKSGTSLFSLPDISLFTGSMPISAHATIDDESRERGGKLEEKLERFGVKGKITAICPGPVITIFEYRPEIDTKISKIMALEDDLALALQALSIRIVAPIPGRNVVGFEISNQKRQNVLLEEVMSTQAFNDTAHQLPIILGVDSVGKPVVEDLTRAPHLLVAGSTGSGKSVGMNAMLFSLLCKKTPDELKLILIDPKRLEFANYADIPHLLFPIVTNPRQAAPVLEWVVQEMEERYDTMARAGVRNMFDYQTWLENRSYDPASKEDEENEYPTMPFIVVMIDELADLMMVAGKHVETHIARIAQMARAAGIHLIVATQRPSVDVLTGVIKVNFPSRIGYRVSSKIDSRTILDTGGAEKLLGRGDMLFMNSASPELQRVHGAYVSDEQIQTLTDHLREQGVAEYMDLKEVVRSKAAGKAEELEDELYDQVRELLKTKEEISISMLQRHFRIGFNRSARIIEQLEMDGLIAPAQGSKPRKVLN